MISPVRGLRHRPRGLRWVFAPPRFVSRGSPFYNFPEDFICQTSL